MFQGITDTYILPPIANAMSLALGLDLGGPGIESSDPESAVFAPLAPLLALGGRATRELPVRDNAGPTGDAVTAVVVQHREDGVEDGHEIMFQLDSAQRQYVQFLASWARGDAVVVP